MPIQMKNSTCGIYKKKSERTPEYIDEITQLFRGGKEPCGNKQTRPRNKPTILTPHSYWKNRKHRVEAIRQMVKNTGKKPCDVMMDDFEKYQIRPMINAYYNASPLKALNDAGYDINPLDRKVVPINYWNNRDTRLKAIRKMVRRAGKKPCDITTEDCTKTKLLGMIANYYNSSLYLALKDAGYDVNPREMRRVPLNYWTPSNITSAVRELVKKSGKKPGNITVEDFRRARLYGLLEFKFRESPYLALKFAGYALNPEDMHKTSQYHLSIRENRIAMVRRLVKKLDKPVTQITIKDFNDAKMIGMLRHYYQTKVFLALMDAGYEKLPWEMTTGVPVGFWIEKINRIYAITWLMRKIQKTPEQLLSNDFFKYRLYGIIKYYEKKYKELKTSGDLSIKRKKLTERIIQDINYGKYTQYIPTTASYLSWIRDISYKDLYQRSRNT